MKPKIVTIERKNIDDNSIQGIILKESKKLLVFEHVLDFRLDGLMVLDKNDISNIQTTDTDNFQLMLMEGEGLIEFITSDLEYNLNSWRSFIESAKTKHKYFIFEEERFEESEFTIGKITDFSDKYFEMLGFSGTARWEERPERIHYSDVTCCQIGSNYINVYARYFARKNA